jgi:sugar/nucleoside kinase (ribokinase family)
LLRVDCKNELLNFLNEKQEKLDAVVMPDFFFDRFISIDYDVASFFSIIADITSRKGGSIDAIAQLDIRGGNAVNTASALAALGVNVTPIICTSKLGLQQIKFYLAKDCVDFSHVKIAEKASLTTALEFRMKAGKANVMLRDVGSLANFSPSTLTKRDYESIENADYVCLFNWAGTRKFGTELAETIFNRVKTAGKGKTYYDTADPTPNKDEISELMRNVLETNSVDVLSLNENEAVCYASIFNDEIRENQRKQRFDVLAMEAARVLAKHLPARIDLHTTVFSATFTQREETIVPTFKIKPLRATGAGDTWNAGNILGDGNALSDKARLTLANAVSAYYLSNLTGAHPTRRKLIQFIENSTLNSPVLI